MFPSYRSQELICGANQLTGFYMMRTLASLILFNVYLFATIFRFAFIMKLMYMHRLLMKYKNIKCEKNIQKMSCEFSFN